MNIFEDLIEELKQENLLESTVIETSTLESENTYNQPSPILDSERKAQEFESLDGPEAAHSHSQPKHDSRDLSNLTEFGEIAPIEVIGESEGETESLNTNENTVPSDRMTDSLDEPFEPLAFSKATSQNESEPGSDVDPQLLQNIVQTSDEQLEPIISDEAQLLANNELTVENFADTKYTDFGLVQASDNPLLSQKITNTADFFRRRATEEVNSLKIVEHIISAIEKDQLKTVTTPYDDLTVSMALHDFLKVANNPSSLEHAQAEFKLMQETENWYSALSQRDNEISVENLRRYCENTRPALSPQALISLARFYRNSPFSETVRGKFDMVITRLLTKDMGDSTREILFNREDLIKQLENLYADWSSIPLYETKEDDSDVLIGVLKFEDFAVEATGATKFEELIRNDFFNRMKIYKESTGEKFFAPLLTATAIESNVIIGNKYVELIAVERERANGKILEDKYSSQLDQSVSEATSKTLQLLELLKERTESHSQKDGEIHDVVAGEFAKNSPFMRKQTKARKFSYLSIAVIVFAILFLGGVYYWSEFLTPEMKTSPGVIRVNLDNSSLKEYFKTARISKNTFYAVTEPAWDRLSKDVKEDVLKKTLSVGSEKGFDKIHVLNSDGKTVAFASDQKIVIEPK